MTHNLLKGKRGIIFGALNEDSIAWKVAVKAVEEGATITLSNTPMALRMGELDGLSKQLNAPVIPADATSVEDLEKVFSESVKLLVCLNDTATTEIYTLSLHDALPIFPQ